MEQDKTQNSIGSSPKKRRTEETVEEEQKEEKKEQKDDMLMPSLFAECHPISNLEDIDGVLEEPPKWVERVEPLLPRSPTVLQNNLSDCHIKSKKFLPRPRLDARITPKTLVCHDYRGGYQADKYLHYVNEEILGEGYPFYNWAQIDIFVYFSHHLITIPPLCWINAGHSNGVKVLGTLITEHNKGNNLCDQQMFKTSEAMRIFARSLAQLTKIFGFDGWLLNIENKVTNIEILKEFVHYFTQLLHSDNPGNLVIWYDSVTESGNLLWQNKLNEKNRCFFDVCDGIFLNYSWTEQHLVDSAKEAKHRKTDVFVGIDIFGRNMFGGGKLFTYKAAELVARHNLSVAIFAPGWTHESIEKGDDNFFSKFLSRDSAFWGSLWPYFYTHPIRSNFTTNFYIGLDTNCYNMFNQQQQLSKFPYPDGASPTEEYKDVITLNDRCNCIQAVPLSSKNSYLLTRKHLNNDVTYVHRLFVCDIEIVENTVVFYLVKPPDAEEVALSLALLTCGVNDKFGMIKLLAKPKEKCEENESILEVNPSEASDVYDRVRARYLKMVDEEGWKLSVYMFNTRPCNVLEVGATIEGGHSVHLGAFGIENADGDFLKRK